MYTNAGSSCPSQFSCEVFTLQLIVWLIKLRRRVRQHAMPLLIKQFTASLHPPGTFRKKHSAKSFKVHPYILLNGTSNRKGMRAGTWRNSVYSVWALRRFLNSRHLLLPFSEIQVSPPTGYIAHSFSTPRKPYCGKVQWRDADDFSSVRVSATPDVDDDSSVRLVRSSLAARICSRTH